MSDDFEAEIDAMSLFAMLAEWRNAPLGRFQDGDPRTEYFQKVMLEKRDADPGGWTAASKELSR